MAVEPIAELPERPSKRSKKSKAQDVAADTPAPERKKKRRKEKDSADITNDVTEDTEAELKRQRKEKRRREKEQRIAEGEEEEERMPESPAPKSSKRRKTDEGGDVTASGVSQTMMDPVAEGEKKKKKRKKEKDLADGEDRSGEPKKKSKRRKTDLPDPNDDESLSDQARKALVYAYAQFSDPSSWKFNKARQNWLIRNIWSEQAIPETHVPLTIRYLTNVQGGVREKLTKACEAALDPPKPAQPSEPAAPPVETSPSAAPPPDVKQLRARAVMDALSSDSA